MLGQVRRAVPLSRYSIVGFASVAWPRAHGSVPGLSGSPGGAGPSHRRFATGLPSRNLSGECEATRIVGVPGGRANSKSLVELLPVVLSRRWLQCSSKNPERTTVSPVSLVGSSGMVKASSIGPCNLGRLPSMPGRRTRPGRPTRRLSCRGRSPERPDFALLRYRHGRAPIRTLLADAATGGRIAKAQ